MSANDPEVAAISAVIAALAGLETEGARKRVLDYVAAKFNVSIRTGSGPLESETPDLGGDSGDLFSRFDHTKPHENVWLLTAEHYARAGIQPFSVTDLKDRADSAGLVVPARIDKTLEGAGKGGKRYYQRVASGRYRLTVHGEAFVRTKYGVRKAPARTTRESGGE